MKDIAGLLDGSDDPRGPSVVVLGASGFVGSAVVAELARLPVRLRAVARGAGVVPVAAEAGIEVRRADLALPGAVAEAVEGADAVVHLAAHIGGQQSWRTTDERSERVNIGIVRDLVEAFRGRPGPPPAVIFAGTLQTGSATAPVPGSYAAQKTAAEAILREATADGTVRGVVLRLATVYGRSPLSGATGRGVLATMAARALGGEPLTMWHDGSVERDFLHVRDAAAAFTAALRHVDELQGGHWVVGSGRLERLGDVFAALSGAVAAHTGKPAVPVLSVPPPDYAEAGDFHTPESDPAAFHAVTGWRAGVPLREGIDDMVTAMAATKGGGEK
ncbi:NAD-dependent epimerase/dehydratase family protein [Streptomyces albireticuli]|uniref:NAD-dependent epimerase/dehydratase family protein n=1 Tax=Streptomyces albireticuli TaxID=1940 RepID=UPI001E337769|nr:NAD-dependent epimerase/dehydratase family protein [Streptomyces albireticuli]MCD9140497.1 NAD-dependent epimerase/dehydratase family protein [Streptomyces albireticuli]MCD9161541.1 NAD-dependent epimerase/dehydratase family protein [Streptomyces albireticuli]MCD9192889.1 NAD-dependent epimerase/dehydratase family protein [Streptomyces albireticuli]